MLVSSDVLLFALYSVLLLLTLFAAYFDVVAAVGIVLFAEIAVPEIPFAQTMLSAGEVCLTAASVVVFVRVLMKRRRGIPQIDNIPAPSVFRTICILFFFLACATLLSIGHAQYHVPVLRETAKVCEYFLAAALGFALTQGRFAYARIFSMLAGIGIIAAISALIELHTGSASVFRGEGKLVPRLAGMLEGPNQLGAFLALLLPFYSLGAIIFHPSPQLRWTMRSAAVLTTITLFLSYSRAGIFSGLFALFAVLFMARQRASPAAIRSGAWVTGLCIISGLSAAAYIAGPAIFHLGTLGNAGDTGAVGHRGELWRAAIAFWHESPFIGIGAGNFEHELARVGLPKVHTHANSLYLQSLAEGGIILFAAVLASIIVPLRLIYRRGTASPFCLATFVALSAFAVHQTVDTLSFYPKIGILAWLLTGAALGIPAIRAAEADIQHYTHEITPLP